MAQNWPYLSAIRVQKEGPLIPTNGPRFSVDPEEIETNSPPTQEALFLPRNRKKELLIFIAF